MIKKYLSFDFELRSFVWLALMFIAFAVIGTLSHELGHIAVAESFGNKSYLHYSSMHFDRNELGMEVDTIRKKFRYEIDSGLPFPEEEFFKKSVKKLGWQGFWISAGGPIQTMAFGTLGLVILYRRRKRNIDKSFTFIDWSFVFLALFWLRQVFNPTSALFMALVTGVLPRGGDEGRISVILGFPRYSLPIFFGIIGTAIVLYIIFKIIPIEKRFTFISAGVTGGLLGFYLWMKVVGPVLLP